MALHRAAMNKLLEWLDNATTKELENEYLYAPEGLRRDGIAIELERRKLRDMIFPHHLVDSDSPPKRS